MDQYNLPDDPTLLFDRFRQGDGSAFKVLYDRYFPMLYLTILKYVERREIAEDIVTNAFIKLYDRRAAFRDADHVYPFLYVAARNEAVDQYRDLRRQRAARNEQAQLVDREYHDPLEAELEREQWMVKIVQAIELLSPARRMIFRMHYFEELSIREIANRLDLTETTVRNQHNRALIFLRQTFLH
jgi:RNA polymerase sigma-70 factor (ECF subfamily)